MEKKLDLALIHLNYNSAYRYGNLFMQALKSLILSINFATDKGFRIAVLFADNASKDHTIDNIKRESYKEATFPYHIVKFPRNYGFAKGNNKAYNIIKKYYESDYIVFINPDVLVTQDWLVRLLKFVSNSKENFGLIQRFTLPTRYFPLVDKISTYLDMRFSENYYFFAKILNGYAILVETKLFEEIGGWDEIFFLYGEDVDLSLKVLSRGRNNAVYIKSLVFHDAHLSTFGTSVLPDIVSRTIILHRYIDDEIELINVLFKSFIYDVLRLLYRFGAKDINTIRGTLYAWKIPMKYYHILYNQRIHYASTRKLLRKQGEKIVGNYFSHHILENIRRRISFTYSYD